MTERLRALAGVGGKEDRMSELFTLARLADLLQSMCHTEPSQDENDDALYYKVSVHLVEDILKALRAAPPVQHQRTDAVTCPYCGEGIQLGGYCGTIK